MKDLPLVVCLSADLFKLLFSFFLLVNEIYALINAEQFGKMEHL